MTTTTEEIRALHDRDHELCLTIPSRLTAIEPVCEQIRGLLGRRHLEDVEFAVEILARECLNNAILHGNRGLDNARVNFGMRIGKRLICLRVTDQGPGFDWRRMVRHGLPADTAVDAEVDLGTTSGSYFIQARLNVSLPGVDPQVAQALVDGAHQQCPYSKATRGNINVVTTLDTKPVATVA